MGSFLTLCLLPCLLCDVNGAMAEHPSGKQNLLKYDKYFTVSLFQDVVAVYTVFIIAPVVYGYLTLF